MDVEQTYINNLIRHVIILSKTIQMSLIVNKNNEIEQLKNIVDNISNRNNIFLKIWIYIKLNFIFSIFFIKVSNSKKFNIK